MHRKTVVALAILATLSSATVAAAATPTEPPTYAALAASATCSVPADHDPAVTKTVYQVGRELNVSDKVMLAGFEAGWVESHMNNLSCGDRDSLGVFQQRPSQGWGTETQVRNVQYAANSFFTRAIDAAASVPGRTPGEVAQAVQRSAYPSRYDAVESKARALLAEASEPVVTPAYRHRTTNNGASGAVAPRVYGTSADEHFVGDWNGDGYDSPGLRYGNTFVLDDNANGEGNKHKFNFGNSGDAIVVGDWNGDGKDTIGLARGNAWYLKDDLVSGNSAVQPVFSFGRASDAKIAGDWDGDGVDTPGAVRGNTWYLRTEEGSAPQLNFANANDTKIAGDWNGDGVDTPGVVRGNTWYLKDNQVSGNGAVFTFDYGRSTDTPLPGDWDDNGTDTAGLVRFN